MLDPYAYPEPAFHFRVILFKDNQVWQKDLRCQSVSGLGMTVQIESTRQPGFPILSKGLAYKPLILKRGVVSADAQFDKDLYHLGKARGEFEPEPRLDLLIGLMNGESRIVRSWRVMHAVITSWDLGEFDAMKNQLLINSLQFQFSDLIYEK